AHRLGPEGSRGRAVEHRAPDPARRGRAFPGQGPEAVSTASVRPARAGDGAGMALCWIDAGRHYIEVDQTRFQVPEEAGLDQWFEASLARQSDDRAVFVAERDGALV